MKIFINHVQPNYRFIRIYIILSTGDSLMKQLIQNLSIWILTTIFVILIFKFLPNAYHPYLRAMLALCGIVGLWLFLSTSYKKHSGNLQGFLFKPINLIIIGAIISCIFSLTQEIISQRLHRKTANSINTKSITSSSDEREL
jgi:hypothetical protein